MGGGGGGIVVNTTGTIVICFSRFFYAFLCLCCFQTRVRVLCFVCVGSWSFRVRIALCLSCWIPDSVIKVLTSFKIFSQSSGLVGNRTSRFIGFSLPEQKFGYFALFVLVLGHSELELHLVYLVGFLDL